MIQENRLEELIEQGATIYTITLDNKVGFINFTNYEGKILENSLKFRVKIKPDLSNWYGCESSWSDAISLSKLFEIKEEVEEYIEFSNIERIEKFPFIPYKEFIKINNIVFESKTKIKMKLAIWVNSRGEKTIGLTRLDDCAMFYFEKPLTQENYREALRVCKNLFLGEENGINY